MLQNRMGLEDSCQQTNTVVFLPFCIRFVVSLTYSWLSVVMVKMPGCWSVGRGLKAHRGLFHDFWYKIGKTQICGLQYRSKNAAW